MARKHKMRVPISLDMADFMRLVKGGTVHHTDICDRAGVTYQVDVDIILKDIGWSAMEECVTLARLTKERGS
jgi:hypothetical protein